MRSRGRGYKYQTEKEMIRYQFLALLCVAALSLPVVLSFSSAKIANRPALTKSHLAVVEELDEIEFQKQTKALCEERNLKLVKVKNGRDLATVPQSMDSLVQPGKLYRMGRVSDATAEDLRLLMEELEIKTLVDLRSPTELKDDPTLDREEVFGDFTDVVWTEPKFDARKRPGCVRELKDGETAFSRGFKSRFRRNKNDELVEELEEEEEDACDVCDPGGLPADKFLDANSDRKERHFVSLMNEFKYVKGTLSKVRKRDIARTIFKSPGALLSRRVRDNIKKPFLDEINQGGLIMLNELLLHYGAPGIRYTLDLCADTNRHPIAFYCTAGKDRTGMIAALILSCLGVPDEDIVQDYSLSANVYAEMGDHKAMVGALSQRNLDPKTFLGAPPHVMREVLVTIREKYGSVEEYLDWIGFGQESRDKLKEALLRKD